MPRGSSQDRFVVAGPWTKGLNDALDPRTLDETELRTATDVIVDVAGRVQRRPAIRVLSAGSRNVTWQVRRIAPLAGSSSGGMRHRHLAVISSDGASAQVASLDLATAEAAPRLEGLNGQVSRWGLVSPTDSVAAKPLSNGRLTGDVAVIHDPIDNSRWYAYACWAGNRWRRRHDSAAWVAFSDAQGTTFNDDYENPNDVHAAGAPKGGFPSCDVLSNYSVGDVQWLLAARGGLLRWSHQLELRNAELTGPQDWSADDYAVFDDEITAIAQHADLLLVFTATQVWITPAVSPDRWQFTLLSDQRGAHNSAVVAEGPAGVAFYDVRTNTLQLFDGADLKAPFDGRHVFDTSGLYFSVAQTPRHVFVACGDEPVELPAAAHDGTDVWPADGHSPQSMFVVDTSTGGFARWTYGATAMCFLDEGDGLRALLGAPVHDDPLRSGGRGGPVVASLWEFTRGGGGQSGFDEVLTGVSGVSPYTASGDASGLSVVARVETRIELPSGWGTRQRWRGARLVTTGTGLAAAGDLSGVEAGVVAVSWVVGGGVEEAELVWVDGDGGDVRVGGCRVPSPEGSLRCDWADPQIALTAAQLRYWRSARAW